MSDQIKISISLWGGGIYTSISGSYLQRRGHPQHKVKIFPNTHVTVAGSDRSINTFLTKHAQKQSRNLQQTQYILDSQSL